MKGKIFLIIGIVLLSVLILVGVFYLFVLSGAIFMFNSNPPAPEVTYGEFPISVTYEVNGEIKAITDVVICEFDGFENRGSAGKYRKWKAYLKSGDNNFGFFPIGRDGITLEVGIFIGSPNYYMGDFEQSKEAYESMMADDRYRKYVEWKNGVKTEQSFSKEEIWERYRFKIIDIQYSPPIQNSFK